MGTDIYLEWDKKTDEESEKQITGWSTRSGDVGYLRASIGMVQENMFLRQIFPDEAWEPNNEKCPLCKGSGESNDYDSKRKWDDPRNWCKACKGNGTKDGKRGMRFVFDDKAMIKFSVYVRLFLGHSVTGISVDSLDSEHAKRAMGMQETIMKAIGGSADNIQTSEVSDNDIFFKVDWVNSVIQFFLLGYEKESEGLNPRVYISW